MTNFDPEAYPEPIDIVNMYRLTLGRDPEHSSIVEERLNQQHREWLTGFFASPEFLEKVYDRVLSDGDIHGGLFDQPPAHGLKQWVATFFPLGEASRDKVVTASDWYELLYMLFSDAAFAGHLLPGDDERTRAGFLDRLKDKHALALAKSIDGALDSVVPGEIVGWALDRHDLDRRLAIELYVNDVFVMAAPAAEYRDDLRDRYGGMGWYGFRLRYDLGPSANHPLHATIKEAGSQATLATLDLPPVEAVVDETLAIRHAISQVRELLERVEARLPALNYGLTLPLTAYAEYFSRYYGASASLRPRGNVDCTLLVDATRHSARALERLLHSVEGQSHLPREIVVLHAPLGEGLEASCCVQAWRQRTNLDVRIAAIDAEGDLPGLAASATRVIDADRIIWCPADHWLQPDAVELLDRSVVEGAVLAYADSDVVRESASGRETHVDPKFRTHFDYDLLLQQNYLDGPVGFRREALLTSDLEGRGAGHLPMLLALRLVETGQDHAIQHVSRILSHGIHHPQATGWQSQQRREIVERHFARASIAAKIEERSDPLGASVPGSLRVRRAPDPSTRVAIIIPTRDRRDLLEPCLTSIFRSQPHNVVSTEIIVVDNRSSEETTLRYLEQIADQEQVRIVAHDGPFNWALMNNRAAAETDADVLVFLNNDTAILSDDCWDEISSNVLRPDIGALGVRLLYEDGKIQHAGAVLDGWTSFSRHEGMGQAASDAGYLGRNALLRRVSTVTGACLATRAGLFRNMGGFDAASLPVEGNDTDYCLRLANRGYGILYDPDATFYHFESKSRGYNRDDRSRLLADEAGHILRARWPDRVGDDPYYNPHFDPLSPPCARLRPPPIIANSDLVSETDGDD